MQRQRIDLQDDGGMGVHPVPEEQRFSGKHDPAPRLPLRLQQLFLGKRQIALAQALRIDLKQRAGPLDGRGAIDRHMDVFRFAFAVDERPLPHAHDGVAQLGDFLRIIGQAIGDRGQMPQILFVKPLQFAGRFFHVFPDELDRLSVVGHVYLFIAPGQVKASDENHRGRGQGDHQDGPGGKGRPSVALHRRGVY